MERLEVSGAVRPICGSLGVRRLIYDGVKLKRGKFGLFHFFLSLNHPSNRFEHISVLLIFALLQLSNKKKNYS